MGCDDCHCCDENNPYNITVASTDEVLRHMLAPEDEPPA